MHGLKQRGLKRGSLKVGLAVVLLTMALHEAAAQSSVGGDSPLPPVNNPTPAPPPFNPPSPPPFNPQTQASPPLNDSQGGYWGALAFTADGSWSTAWKEPSKAQAEATVLRSCAAMGHGSCDVATISGQECVALATFAGNYRRRRWLLAFTAGGATYPEAQMAAMNRCNSDERTRGGCHFRAAACADGR